jgi:hypothetical protein
MWVHADDDSRHTAAPRLDRSAVGEEGRATSSWAYPSGASPRHGDRPGACQMRATPKDGGQPR